MSRLGLALSGVATVLALGAFAATGVVAQQSGPAAEPSQSAPDTGGTANAGRDRDDWRRDEGRGGRGGWGDRERWRRDRRSFDDDDRGDRGRGWRYGAGDRDGDGRRRWDDRRGFDSERWGRDGHRGHRHGQGPQGGMMGPGMMGPGMMGPRRMGRLCGPNGDRLATAMLDRLERITQPTDAQRPIFDKLKEAAGKAHEAVKASCPTGPAPITPPGRLAAAEKRLDAMLGAVRTIRPALEEFYASLSEEQKARLYISRGRPDGWRDRSEHGQRGGEWHHRRLDGPRQGGREERRERFQQNGYGRDDGRFGRSDRDRDGWPDSWRGRS